MCVLAMAVVDETFVRPKVPLSEAADGQGGHNSINLGRLTDSVVGVVGYGEVLVFPYYILNTQGMTQCHTFTRIPSLAEEWQRSRRSAWLPLPAWLRLGWWKCPVYWAVHTGRPWGENTLAASLVITLSDCQSLCLLPLHWSKRSQHHSNE